MVGSIQVDSKLQTHWHKFVQDTYGTNECRNKKTCEFSMSNYFIQTHMHCRNINGCSSKIACLVEITCSVEKSVLRRNRQFTIAAPVTKLLPLRTASHTGWFFLRENAIYWLRRCQNMRNATCSHTQTLCRPTVHTLCIL